MATWWTSPLGGGTGNGTQASPVTLAAAAAGAVAGDVVNLLSGNYIGFPTPARSGTSSAPITFQAAAGALPIIEGGFGAAQGGAGPTNLQGWSPVTLPYSDAGTNIYRRTLQPIYGIWANDFQSNGGTGIPAGTPTGRGCSLWNMWKNDQVAVGVHPNPDWRISVGTANTVGESGQQMKDGNWQYRINSNDPSIGDTSWGPDGTVDIRLNFDNPSGYTITAGAGYVGLDLSGVALSWIIWKGIYFRRWNNWIRFSDGGPVCSNLTFDGCDFRYAAKEGVHLSNGGLNITFKNGKLIGAGSIIGTYDDIIAIGTGSANLTLDNNEIAYFGDAGISCLAQNTGGHILNNNVIHHGVNGINWPVMPPSPNNTITNNVWHHIGQISFVGAAKQTHFALQLSAMIDSVIKGNVIYDCGRGMYLSTAGIKQFSGNQILRNTFVDCERQCIEITSDGSQASNDRFFNNVFRNNIFYGPSGAGNEPGDHKIDFYWNNWATNLNGNIIDHNLFFAPGSGVVFQDDTGGLGPTTPYTSIAAAQLGFPQLLQSNQQGDPLFVNYASRDFHLTTNSPARGMGVSIDGTTDVGALPFGAAPPPPPTGPSGVVITPSVTTGPTPLTVSFTGSATAGSSPITSYAWVFTGGNPATSSLQNPSGVVFTSVGTHNVTLTVTDANALTASNSVTITVTAAANNPPTNVQITASTLSGVAPLTVTFSGSATAGTGAITGWAWSFQGGNPPTANVQNPGAVSFAAVGTHTVTLTVTDANALTASASVTITVTAPPMPQRTYYPWISFVDQDGVSTGILGPAKAADGKDSGALDASSRWFYDGALPRNGVGDLGSDRSVGGLRLTPVKAGQGKTYTVTIETQPNASSTWTPRVTNGVTTPGALYTDFSWTPVNIRKIRITVTAATMGGQLDIWELKSFDV